MEIIFKSKEGQIFGSTKYIGLGRRQPKLIYGAKAKELRENANMTIEGLAGIFEVKPKVIEGIENQTKALEEPMCKKYIKQFGVEKEYFFDLELESVIINDQNVVLADFDTNKECKEAFDNAMEDYFKALDEGREIFKIDFSLYK